MEFGRRLFLLCLASAAAPAAPGPRDDSVWLQAAIDLAARERKTFTLSGGAYRLLRGLNLPPNARVAITGCTFLCKDLPTNESCITTHKRTSGSITNCFFDGLG